MIKGETVVVERRERTGTDPGNNPIYDWVPETVEDVLVAPGPLADVVESTRPEGVRVVWQLHFPKGYPATLAGARVKVRGGDPIPVVGKPEHYTEANTPGRWSMPCELGIVEG